LGDFRVHSFESAEKWFALIFLAYTFLQWRLNYAHPYEKFKVVADVIRHHRQEHAREVLEAACQLAITCRDISQVFRRFINGWQPVLV
jgi:hypothetical protein